MSFIAVVYAMVCMHAWPGASLRSYISFDATISCTTACSLTSMTIKLIYIIVQMLYRPQCIVVATHCYL